MTRKTIQSFFGAPLNVVNVGLRSFAESLQAQSIPVAQVDWRPPLVPRLQITREGVDIEAANTEATRRIMQGRPMLVGMEIAREVIPGYHDRLILHAGPPITWERMCGPQRGAVMGALVHEGLDWRRTNRKRRTWPPAERSNSPPAITTTRWGRWRASSPPRCRSSSSGTRPSATSPMPRETRGWGGCSAMTRMAPTSTSGCAGWRRYSIPPSRQRSSPLRAVCSPPQYWGGIKGGVLPPQDWGGSRGGIDLWALISQELYMGDECHNRLTVMARNGTDFGIRMTGMPDRWFVAPAGIVDDLYLPGFTAEDGNPDIGDSTVTKTAGFGGFAMATAPAIAHKEPGIGMVGAGVLRAPGKCFAEAFEVMREW